MPWPRLMTVRRLTARLLSPRLRFALAVFLLNFALLLAFRLAFAVAFRGTGGQHAARDVLAGLYLGVRFDLRLALLALLPLLLLDWLPPLNPVRWRAARFIWLAYGVVATLAAAAFYVVDVGHYLYLGTRLNASALRLLAARDIALEMVWQSYPVLWVLLGMVGVAAAMGWLHWRLAFPQLQRPGGPHPLWQRATMGALCAGLVLSGLYGKVSWYPLRWSDAFFVADPYVNALGLNPVLYFFDTYENQSLGYDEQAVRAAYPLVSAYLGVERPDAATLNFVRERHPRGLTKGPYNLVLIHLESFAARYTGSFGNGANPTPYFDEIARNGLLFTHYYVPSPGTARSVFAALTGLPDVMGSGSTATRNPQIVTQHVLLDDFRGYKRFYFLGGSASWGNIRGLLMQNIAGIDLREEGSYSEPRTDVWGISDLALFREANESFRAAGNEPFVAMIQTAGNHRPYTIPAQRGDFQLEQRDAETLERYGFTSLAELNGVRFLDYSLGRFLELARQEPYFQRTIFLLYGDHGIPGDGQHLTPAQIKLYLTVFHVPFVIYAPSLFPQGRVIDEMASEVDMLPTAAGIMGLSYRYTGLGRDLLDATVVGPRYAFTMLMDSPPAIGLLDHRFYFRMDASRGAKLYEYLSPDPEVPDVSAEHPEQAARMQRLASGLWETARYLLHHNRPERFAAPPPGLLAPGAAKP